MWMVRDRLLGRIGMSTIALSAGIWGCFLLQRNSSWLPELRWVLLALTILGAVGFAFTSTSRLRILAPLLLALALIGALGGGSAYALATFEQPHTGGSPAVGPKTEAGSRGFGFSGSQFGSGEAESSADGNAALDTMLVATTTKWSAAIDRSSAAATLEFGSNTPVMAIGGFSNDPAPTLKEFVADVADHRITYFVEAAQVQGGQGSDTQGSGSRGPGSRGPSEQKSGQDGKPQRSGGHADITTWVESHFTATTVGNYTVYDVSGYVG